MSSSQTDWNSKDEFFNFTHGRFIVDEGENLRKREVRFDMRELAKVAADSVGATKCISVKKYSDGMFNKAFLLAMDNGREVVAKVPNPNAGIPHLTTASEVATMDFARNVLDTPAPRVHAWNSRADSHRVGAEFIIMDKAKGVPLSQVWDTMMINKRLQDMQSQPGNQYVQDGQPVKDSEFAIGPATGRDWADAGRSAMDIERGPWKSLSQYLQAVGNRETKAIQSLSPPKQIALFCGPKLYHPDTDNKLTALAWYRQIVDALDPKDTAITNPRLWHNDLHDDNIFVDPENFGKITCIIDWQSCHISPLFNHHPDPGFLHWDGLEPETLDLLPKPNLSGLSREDRTTALREYTIHNTFLAWRKLMHAKNPDLYKAVEFRKATAYGLIFLAHRMFEYGEAHFQSLLVDLKDTWKELPAATHNIPYPFDFSAEEVDRIKIASDNAVAGTELVAEVKESMADLWPDKGFIEHERYDECKAALDEVKLQVLEQLAETDEERAEYERCWPFD